MKKTYINPEIHVIRVQTSGMIAVSNRNINNTAASINATTGEYNDARGGSDWDDED